MNKITALACTLALYSLQLAAQTPQLGKASNEDILKAMKMEEKARLLVGMGMKMPAGIKPPEGAQGPAIGSTEDKVPGAAGTTATFKQYGIPGIVVADGPAGLRISPTRPDDKATYYATAFPIATLLAASWDPELVYRTGQAMGNEVKEYGVDIILGPGMNIHRNPLGGRNFEYYSEDPLLSGKIASAMVKGIQSNGVGTSIKHFVANNHETNRNLIDVSVSERALREIYLRGFEITVKEAQPWTVMSSYNKINGTYTSESANLLKTVLRKEWGYQGLVMSDWFGGQNAVEQMRAGNDLLMPGTPQQLGAITDAVKSGKLEEKYIDENANDLLNLVKKTQSFKGTAPSNKPDLRAHGATARQAAVEGMVLLKNELQTLPIKAKKLAVFGNYSYALVSGGTGSGDVNEAYTVQLPEGLRNSGFALDKELQQSYEKYVTDEKAKQPPHSFFVPPAQIAEMPLDAKKIAALAAANDIALITLSRIAGEGMDRKVKDDYYLFNYEKQLIKLVSKAFHAQKKKVVVILNTGGVIETASWKNQVDAILEAWLPGQEAGTAIADVLSGKVNPSGKLPTSFLVKYEDDPTAKGFPGKAYGEEVNLGFMKMYHSNIEYQEGVYVGYRAFDKKRIKTSFPFGYGLSYTSFTYSDIKLSDSKFNGMITVSVTVKNTGTVNGKEVAQLYLSAPGKSMDKPLAELKGFAKTRLLQPGESQTLSFDLDARALASFDEARSAWMAEPGTYMVHVGASSRDFRLNATFNLDQELEVEKTNKLK